MAAFLGNLEKYFQILSAEMFTQQAKCYVKESEYLG